MYIGCGRLSIINTEGQMRIFLMTPVGVVVTTRGHERVNEVPNIYKNEKQKCIQAIINLIKSLLQHAFFLSIIKKFTSDNL